MSWLGDQFKGVGKGLCVAAGINGGATSVITTWFVASALGLAPVAAVLASVPVAALYAFAMHGVLKTMHVMDADGEISVPSRARRAATAGVFAGVAVGALMGLGVMTVAMDVSGVRPLQDQPAPQPASRCVAAPQQAAYVLSAGVAMPPRLGQRLG